MDDAGGANGAYDANCRDGVRNSVADTSAETVVQAGSIGQVTINQGAARPPVAALRSLPPRPHTVVGRERDLATLLGHLRPAGTAEPISPCA
ncbi:hypothetical protein [Streptomyces thermolilacinus]|uniref:Uncharacterized protein n=1 Tax=Streptomyces thermolilacinus SPC6 TaxID=1306406 RepID=A0A1D3DMS9_9ACTN|nr:hypothetical protein [Streptomyces thermolilacinus]OEJ93626.1 hypothetical protein J116_003245 [Streptomyces thermolilacinus SPC6]